jgi:tetratricopeptide (TPR) repeat protein
MSENSNSTAPRATPHPNGPIRALLQAGRNDEAIVKLCALVVMRPQDWAAKHLLFDAFFQKREWAPALALIEELNRQRPGDARLQKALVVTLSNMKRYNEAIAQAHRHIARHGEDPTIIDVLKVAHFYTGKLADAVNYGQRGLELRDAEASALPPAGIPAGPAGSMWMPRCRAPASIFSPTTAATCGALWPFMTRKR